MLVSVQASVWGIVRTSSVVVMGGGVAGLATAVLLAHAGQRVTLLERDSLRSDGPAEGAPAWPRAGIPHFLQPHAFVPRRRSELRRNLPDVYAALFATSGSEVDTRPKLAGLTTAEDEELQYLAVRRPLIEWALRRAAVAEPALKTWPDSRVDGRWSTAAGSSAFASTALRSRRSWSSMRWVVVRRPLTGWRHTDQWRPARVERLCCHLLQPLLPLPP